MYSVDYDKLSVEYPELCKFMDAGRLRFTYESQCALTAALLHKFHGINISILKGHLIPAVPSRAVYLKIVRRVFEESCGWREDDMQGLDIGAGPYAIYAVLAFKLYGCNMTGVDIDPSAVEHAKKIVLDNKLPLTIELGDGITGSGYDFMVCNPPFYASIEEMKRRNEDKSELCREPVVGTECELVCTEGEVGFVMRLIDQSRGQCLWFSSLLGLKSSVSEIITYLISKRCANFHVQEYHLGNTKRWILFWSHEFHRPMIVHSNWANVKVTVFEHKFDLEKVKAVTSKLPLDVQSEDDKLLINVPGIVWSRQYRRSGKYTPSRHTFILTAYDIHFRYGEDFKTFQSFYNYLRGI